MTLTKRQLQVLVFYHQSVVQDGFYPTLHEAAKHFKCTRNTIYDHLESLIRKGFATKAPDIARGIKITEKGMKELQTDRQCRYCRFDIPDRGKQ